MSGYHPAPCYDPLGSAPNLNCPTAVLALASDNRSQPAKSGSGHQWRVWFVLAGALLVPACAPREQTQLDDSSLSFREVVGFQTQNLTTDLVSVPERQGLAAVDYGWQRGGEDRTDSWLTLREKVGRLVVFSADGDVVEIQLELSLEGSVDGQRRPVQLLWNDRRLQRLRLDSDWSSYSVTVPADVVRQGINTVELMPRFDKQDSGKRRRPLVRLRRLRIRSLSGRPVWPARPRQIRLDTAIQMPVASYLDLVARVPERGRLEGSYDFDSADSDAGPAYTYIQLMDESQKEWTLLNKRLLRTLEEPQEVDLDLGDHAGELVRLRVGTTGSANGVVRWHDLKLTTPMPHFDTQISTPPISRSDPPRSGRLGQPDVYVVLLDAARADAFSLFGAAHPTPATERLAIDGTAFHQAFSTAPWTGQSVPSMLTGLFPDTLRSGPLGSGLPDEIPTLPELMSANGYRTVLWTQHPLYRNHKSFQRGFQKIHQTTPGGYEELPGALELLDDQRPTFAWIHLIPPHTPYQPPRPFRGQYSSWYSGSMTDQSADTLRIPSAKDAENLTEDDIRYLKDRYLENVGFADSLVARFLAELEQAGRYRTSLIVLLSDHGEAFMEHGILLHTRNVHTELLHVPLVVKWPDQQQGFAAAVFTPVSLVDLVPTLVDGLDLAGAADGFQGRSLLPRVFAGSTESPPVYAMTRGLEDRRKPSRPWLMLQADNWRTLFAPLADSGKLYRLDEDPGEDLDLASSHPLQQLLLRQGALSQHSWNRRLLEAPGGAAIDEKIDPEVLEQLKALGYLN